MRFFFRIQISYSRHKMAFCENDRTSWDSTGAVASGNGHVTRRRPPQDDALPLMCYQMGEFRSEIDIPRVDHDLSS